MSNIGSKAIYMSLKQLLIIFYQRKVDGILMPDAMSDIDADDRQLKEAMAKMIGEGLLVPGSNGKLTLSDEAKEIADIIAGAQRIFHIGNGAMPQQFLYEVKGRGVLMNLDTMNPERARLELGDVKELLEGVTTYEGMPRELQSGDAISAPELDRDTSIEEILDIPEVVTVVDRYQRGSEKAMLRVIVREGRPYLLSIIKEETSDNVYDSCLFVNSLLEE